MPNAVYDKEDEKADNHPGQHDDLGMNSDERQSEVDALDDNFYRDEGPDLQTAESTAGGGSSKTKADKNEGEKVDGLYNDEKDAGTGGFGRKAKALLSTKKGKALVGGGVGGGILGLGIFGMLLFPLKIMHMANNLQNNFFSSAEQAGEDMTDHLLRAYVVHKVLPGMIDGRCSSTKVDKSCAKVADGSGPIAILYSAWRDNNLEGKLASKHGIEIKRNGNKFTLITNSTGAGGVDLGEFDQNNQSEMDRRLTRTFNNRADLRREVRTAFEANTFSKRIMYRFKVGPLLERKYGIKRCLIACDTRDRFSDNADAKKLAFKAYFIQKIVTPRSEMYGLAMQCALSGFTCVNDVDTNDDGTEQTQFETDLREKVNQYAAAGNQLDDLQKLVDDFNKVGFGQTMLTKVFGEMAAHLGAKAIPVVGWIDLGATLFSAGSRAGPALTKMNYVAMAATGVTAYQMFLRTPADEIKSGEIDPAMLGSISEALGPNAGSDQGGLGAEASPYYQELMGGGATKSTASVFGSSKVYAAGSGYVCDEDGLPPAKGELLCPEEKYDSSRGFTEGANSVAGFINGPLKPFATMSNLWIDKSTELISAITSPIGDALAAVAGPLFDEFTQKIEPFITAFAKWFADFAFNNPVTENMSGARWFHIIANGADEAGNSTAHYAMGASAVDYATAESIRTARANERYEAFKSQSMIARLTDTDSQYSLATQFAMSVPGTSLGNTTTSVASSMLNPFSVVASSLSGFMPSSKASAARDKSPAGITQYAWDPKDEVFSMDPEEYIKKYNCESSSQVKEWNEKYTTKNPKTGMPELTKSNGCLLLNSGIAMGGAYYTDKLLTAEELGNTDSAANGETGFGFTAATFNILHSDDEPPEVWKPRLHKSVAVIKENDVDIAGLQEVRPDQTAAIQTSEFLGDTYEMWPNALKNPEFNPNPIIWKSAEYRALSKEYITAKYFDGSKMLVPIIKFEDVASGEQFYFANTHDPAKKENVSYRTENAKTYFEYFKALKARDDVPALIVGDFNSAFDTRQGVGNITLGNTRDNLAYCILTTDDLFWNAYDAASSKKGKCPSKDAPHQIDHIYVSTDVSVTSYSVIPGGRDKNGSDHNAIIADIGIGTLGTGAGTDFVIGTYNQPVRGNAGAASAKILENKMDVVGMQEQAGSNYDIIRKDLKGRGYGVYPDSKSGRSGHCATSRPIYFNKDKFKLVKGEVFDVPSYEANKYGPKPDYINPVDCGGGEQTKGGGRANVPIAWLEDVTTKQAIMVINTHNLANCCGGGGEQAAKKRYLSAQIYVEKIKELTAAYPGVPIFFTGDYNEGTGVRREGGTNTTWERNHNNLLYCMLTKQTKIMFRAAGSKDQPCANDNEGIGGVDYIYATPGVKVEWTKGFQDPSTNDSPHEVIFARLVVPGSGKTASGKTGWPLGEADWKANKSDYLDAHGDTGTAWGENNFGTNGNKGAYIAADLGSDVGKPVYSMFDGEVTSTNLCTDGGDDGIAIKSNLGGGTVGVAYMHGQNKKFKKGDTVKAGDHIMDVGVLGCKVRGSHLHIGMVFNSKYVCPSDIFLAMAENKEIPWSILPGKAARGCGRSS